MTINLQSFCTNTKTANKIYKIVNKNKTKHLKQNYKKIKELYKVALIKLEISKTEVERIILKNFLFIFFYSKY